MTDMLTTPRVPTTEKQIAKPNLKKGRIIAAAVLAGALAGGGVFLASQPDRAAIEQAHWQQVVDYYEAKFPAAKRAAIEQAHWQRVVDYYEAKFPAADQATP